MPKSEYETLKKQVETPTLESLSEKLKIHDHLVVPKSEYEKLNDEAAEYKNNVLNKTIIETSMYEDLRDKAK